MRPKLCLGTAQFGMHYGVTNQMGRLKDNQIDLIIESALNNNIFYFDTANAYGNSEIILGNTLKNNQNIKFITKFNSTQLCFILLIHIYYLLFTLTISFKN